MDKSTEQTVKAKPSYDELVQLIEQLSEENRWLKEQFKLSQSRQFASSSESSHQAELFESSELSDEDDNVETTMIAAHQRKVKKNKNGRNIDTSKLSREVIHYDLTEEEKQCEGCGQCMVSAGVDRCEQIDFEPAKLKVIEYIQEKYACRQCERITQAKKPESPLGKVMATPRLVAEVAVKKYQHHVPLYRQSKIFKQDGALIPDNTLSNWLMKAGAGLLPLGDALCALVKQSSRLQVDETPVKSLDQKSKGYLWCFYSYDPRCQFAWYQMASNRQGSIVESVLGDYGGVLHTDGYSGYNAYRKNNKTITPGCWAHARRKYMDVIKANAIGKGLATNIVSAIDKLFKVDAEYKEKNLLDSTDVERWYADRLAVRQTSSAAIIDEIKVLMEKGLQGLLKKSSIGNALNYTRRQWPYLILALQHGDCELSTNWVENLIRPFALGRKNWLFVRGIETGKIIALFYSLIQTCIMHDIEPRRYLTYVFNQIPKLRRGDVDSKSLLPQFIDPSLLT
jgi:transposase